MQYSDIYIRMSDVYQQSWFKVQIYRGNYRESQEIIVEDRGLLEIKNLFKEILDKNKFFDLATCSKKTPIELLIAIGDRLSEMMLPEGEVREIFEDAFNGLGAEEGLRIRLVLDPKFEGIPWEYCHMKLNGKDGFLLAYNNISLVRYTFGSRVYLEPRERLKIRIDEAWTGQKRSTEFKKIFSDLKNIEESIIEDASPNQLPSIEADIFHFHGHGSSGEVTYHPQGEVEGEHIGAIRISQLLAGSGVQLLVFCSCHSGSLEDQEKIGINHQSLIKDLMTANIPALVAMQYLVDEQDMIKFATCFYRKLDDVGQLDKAIAICRQEIINDFLRSDGTRSYYWGVPVLYLRSPDGELLLKRSDSIQEFLESIVRGEEVSLETIKKYYKHFGTDFLETVIERLYNEVIEGKSLSQIIDDKPFAEININKLISVIEDLQIGEEDIIVDPQKLYMLGCLSIANCHYDAALIFFRMAIQIMASRDYIAYVDAFEAIARLQLFRAQQDLANSKLDSAIEKLKDSIKAAVSLDPSDKNTPILRGYIFKTMAQVADANKIKFLEKAKGVFKSNIERYPEDESAYNGLGNYYYGIGEIDEAIKLYLEAIRINNKYSAAWHDLGLAYEAKMMRDPERCKDALNAYIESRRLAENELKIAQENPDYAQYLVFSPADIEILSQRIKKLEQDCKKLEKGT